MVELVTTSDRPSVVVYDRSSIVRSLPPLHTPLPSLVGHSVQCLLPLISSSTIRSIGLNSNGLNSNLASVLVNNLRNSFVNMRKSEDDPVLKRSSLMMLLNSDVDDLKNQCVI